MQAASSSAFQWLRDKIGEFFVPAAALVIPAVAPFQGSLATIAFLVLCGLLLDWKKAWKTKTPITWTKTLATLSRLFSELLIVTLAWTIQLQITKDSFPIGRLLAEGLALYELRLVLIQLDILNGATGFARILSAFMPADVKKAEDALETLTPGVTTPASITPPAATPPTTETKK